MNRSDWDSSDDVDAMLRQEGEANLDRPRPVRLFACACGRLVWNLFSDRIGRPSIEISERFADGRAGWGDLRSEFVRLRRAMTPEEQAQPIPQAAFAILMTLEYSAARAGEAARHVREVARSRRRAALSGAQADLVRDIFGDPFEPEVFDPSWRTSSAVDLAQSIYEEEAFDRMPILGDALEEAGCSSVRVLEHCRGGGAHVRGCWVVDQVVGKR